MLFKTHVRFRPPFAGPFTETTQAEYDKLVQQFAEYFIDEPTPTDMDSQSAVSTPTTPSRDALSWALSSWLANAVGEDVYVRVPDSLPATFGVLMDSVRAGQSQHVQDRVSFLTSSDSLRSLDFTPARLEHNLDLDRRPLPQALSSPSSINGNHTAGKMHMDGLQCCCVASSKKLSCGGEER